MNTMATLCLRLTAVGRKMHTDGLSYSDVLLLLLLKLKIPKQLLASMVLYYVHVMHTRKQLSIWSYCVVQLLLYRRLSIRRNNKEFTLTLLRVIRHSIIVYGA